ncbi:MAG: hypothetical protein LBM19_04135 [Holosporales bacterium]|jgi:hypoxanthine phosphoribosyltransferase|nr:hypothetical protein [Holosporales bacterium]
MKKFLAVLLGLSLCSCQTYNQIHNKDEKSLANSFEQKKSASIEDVKAIQKKLKLVYSSREIDNTINRMAKEMNAKFKDKNPIAVCVLQGSLPFVGRLLPKLSFNMEFDCLYISSFEGEERKDLKWVMKPRVDCKGRDVILFDDVVDSGLTLATLVQFYKDCGAKNVYTAVLTDKKGVRHPNGLQQVDFVGFSVPGDYFLVGYGLDYDGYLRNLPGIYIVNH